MGGVFRSELLKLRRSPIWLVALVSPALTTLTAALDGVAAGAAGREAWIMLIGSAALLHGLLFLPLLTGVFSALVCRFEHAGGGWKQLLALPVKRGAVFGAKLALVMGLLGVVQLLVLAGLLAVAAAKGLTADAGTWGLIVRCFVGGWVACLPLAALQMFVSVVWQSFAAPLAVNVIFTLPNILVANSEKYGPYYPWAQPVLAMVPREAESFGAFNVPLESLLLVVLGSFGVFLTAGMMYFAKVDR
ncbi:ABC transporter permease [Paenibacillus sp. TRM 82003]|nr:ABC transporter permease [Paenibacillus sp. TRM 82003]